MAAEKQGFRRTSVNEVSLEVGARVSIDIVLEIGQTTELVEVTARPTIR